MVVVYGWSVDPPAVKIVERRTETGAPTTGGGVQPQGTRDGDLQPAGVRARSHPT
jgi:hypothetical protein